MQTVYHGTFWQPDEESDPPNAVFFEPSTSMSDLDAVWFTDNEDVAKFFSSYNLDDAAKENGTLRVILKGTLEPLKAISFTSSQSPWVAVTEEADEVHVQNREELYPLMRTFGFNAFVIEDNYQEFDAPGSDIAVLKDGMFECQQVALEKKDGTFTPFMDMNMDKAEKIFLRHAASVKRTLGSAAAATGLYESGLNGRTDGERSSAAAFADPTSSCSGRCPGPE